MFAPFRPVALIPAYQAGETVARVVRGTLQYVERVLVVDDGSTDETAQEASLAGAEVLRLAANGGKGTALRAGLQRVLASAPDSGSGAGREATHVVLLDADAQHDPADLPALLDAAREGDDFVIGSRMGRADEIPPARYHANEIGSRILTRMTGHEIQDAQSGYRVIAADLLRRLRLNSRGYLIETEMLLKAAPHLTRLREVPVRVVYGGRSHYRPFRDTWIISWGAVYYKVFECD